MVPGGTTESIAHFIGYLHLLEDTARNHPTFAGAPGTARTQGGSDLAHHDAKPDLSLDDLASRPIVQTIQPGAFSLIGIAKHKLLPPPPIGVPHPHLGHVPPVEAGPHDPALPAPGLTLYRSDTVGELWAPAPLPDQLLADLRQANVLHNDGVALTAPMPPALEAIALSHDLDGARQLPELVAQAQANTPNWLAGVGQGQSLAQAVAAHDADPAGHATPATPPGLYADGVPQPDGSAFAPALPTTAAVPATSHNGLTDPGVDAHTGGNTAINIASILDNHTQHTGLAVMGNAYTTDAIVQINVLHSLADIAVGGATGPENIDTGGNTAHNLASFAHHDLSATSTSVNVPWAHLQVDTIRGDFYDVKTFSQINVLSSNDIVSQSASSAYSAVAAGGNVQVNDLPFSELAGNYDLVIVGGSFHNANAIVQQNIFLNDDVVRMLSGRGEDASQSVSTGHNSLSNSAAIDHYGTTTTQPMTADLAAWLTQLENGSLGEGGALPSAGSSLMHVLYITGDFFDINALSQTNIVSNVDTVAQVLPHASDVQPGGVSATPTMSIDTGHNQLANLAGISVVGTTSALQFVGGQHYDDAILVQANLVSDKAHVAIGDTHTLASELIAFTGAHDAAPAAHDHVAHMVTDPSLHHDLFHGIMT